MIQLTATDADDPTYGNSARVVYSILEGQPYFSVDAKTGTSARTLRNPRLLPGKRTFFIRGPEDATDFERHPDFFIKLIHELHMNL